jgi:hypothetical protein
MEITKELWAKAPDGKEIYRYTLKNASGAYVQLTNIGRASWPPSSRTRTANWATW